MSPRLGIPVEMADGTVLATDLYLPEGAGPWPALLTRTPYERNRGPRPAHLRGSLPTSARGYRELTGRGFAVAVQDVRGRGDSGGEFVPFVHEAADGAAALDWLRAHPVCDGRVGTFGIGYGGFTALAAAGARPTELLGVAAFGAWGPPGQGLRDTAGIHRLDWLLWVHLTSGRVVQPSDLPTWTEAWRAAPERAEEILGRIGGRWPHWLQDEQMWAATDLTAGLRRLDAPGLHVGGRWDQALSGTLAHWRAACQGPAGERQHLVVGPWTHDGLKAATLQTAGFGFGASSTRDPLTLLAEFFSGVSKPEVFVTGADEWVASSSWPPATRTTRLWLNSAGACHTRNGDGRLAYEPGVSSEVSLDLAPGRPTPWQEHLPQTATMLASLDQAALEMRDDALVYTTARLNYPLRVVGQPSVSVRASGHPTLFALLSDVLPDDRSLHLAHGVLQGQGHLTGPLSEVAHEFRDGHRLRLTLTANLYPLYPDTVTSATTMIVDSAPSRLDLPVVV